MFQGGGKGKNERSRKGIYAKYPVLFTSFIWFISSNICQGKFYYVMISKNILKTSVAEEG